VYSFHQTISRWCVPPLNSTLCSQLVTYFTNVRINTAVFTRHQLSVLDGTT